ncbi:MAG: Hsp20/alpha crystallin family protein [Chitinophagaceae bacterium]|nr:MAG: Hsp20/alpha crystallin family protein [Chitinophagaceae bacterium]
MTHVRFNRQPLQRSFNNLVDDLFPGFPVVYRNEGKSVPVNITENETSYQIDVVAPGFDKADFKVNVDQQLLTIEAEVKENAAGATGKQIRREHQVTSFKRTFTLDEKIEANSIEATYVNGVLVLNLPKKTEVKQPAQQISIK